MPEPETFDTETFDFDKFEAKEDKSIGDRAIWVCLLNYTCPCCWEDIPRDSKLGRQITASLKKAGERRNFDATKP